MTLYYRNPFIFALLTIVGALTACNHLKKDGGADAETDGNNAIYYWRTTFELKPQEREFLKNHDIRKLYLRFFDVDNSSTPVDGEYMQPHATVRFADTIPEGIAVVPTVYITLSAIYSMERREEEFAGKIVRRVSAICRRYGIDFGELQLDCDWTGNSQGTFFNLCRLVKEKLGEGKKLSSTVRLHQLVQDPPPVDCGVLMVYNTGNIQEITTENSIFSLHDIEPYLTGGRLKRYPLPLDVAYPVYSWSLTFWRAGENDKWTFQKINRRTDFDSFPQMTKIADNTYEVIKQVDIASAGATRPALLYPGERVRIEQPDPHEIIKVKSLIDSQLSGRPHTNILYHLDNSQLSRYTTNEISNFFRRN